MSLEIDTHMTELAWEDGLVLRAKSSRQANLVICILSPFSEVLSRNVLFPFRHTTNEDNTESSLDQYEIW